MNRADAIIRRLGWPLLGILLVFAGGFVGYLAFGFGAVDAFAQTVLVLTTVGFSTRAPLGAGEKVFTGAVAVLGVSMYLAFLAVVVAAMSEGQLGVQSRRRRMQRRIDALRDHIVICAYGRVGRAAAREFEAEGVPFVVVDRKEELEAQMQADGVVYLIGDPTSEAVLRRAGIERARALVCAVDSDADNVYIVLTGRSLNPDLFIVARASAPETPARLYRAGANRVVSPYVTSGRHMALAALRPRVVDYLEITGRGQQPLRLEELVIEEGSPLVGRTLGEICGQAAALLVRRHSGETIPNPSRAERVRGGDLVVFFGEPATLRPVEEA